MFPLTLLRKAENRAMLVELKNGETYNGHLQSCDTWMNLQLREVTLTSRVSAPNRLNGNCAQSITSWWWYVLCCKGVGVAETEHDPFDLT